MIMMTVYIEYLSITILCLKHSKQDIEKQGKQTKPTSPYALLMSTSIHQPMHNLHNVHYNKVH